VLSRGLPESSAGLFDSLQAGVKFSNGFIENRNQVANLFTLDAGELRSVLPLSLDLGHDLGVGHGLITLPRLLNKARDREPGF